MINLKGKTALVTGGGAGMGRAIAEAFGMYGVRVVVAEINADRAETVRNTFEAEGIEALVEVVDVRDKKRVAALADKIETRYGGLDILVNNVGDFMGIVGPFATSTEEQWDTLYQVNLKQMFVVTHAMLPLMRKSGHGGSIINVSSIEGFRGIPGGVVYGAFKAGITGFTQSLAVELGPEHIRVNTIAPETTDTEQVQVTKWTNPKYMSHTERWIPLGRFGVPQDAAGCAIFLASDLSAWVTGTTIHMDGGALAAAGWYRTPEGQWTNMPVIADKGLIF
ncbi:MAG: Short-chain dehydrogenase [Rhodospirillales bacterium]|nr:Short-chain dehydrogenase [Rhodospirillales bacterium]